MLNLFLFFFALLQKLTNIRIVQKHLGTMQIQELKTKFVFIFFDPQCKIQAFCRVLTYTVGKVLVIPFRINNHIVQKYLGTMKCLELKVELVFIFLTYFAKTRNSAVFQHTPLKRSWQGVSGSIITLCIKIFELLKFGN